MELEDITVTIDADETEETIDIPVGLLDRLAEPEETNAEVIGSVLLMAFAGRAHALLHHIEGEESDEELEAIEDQMLDRFEERFGVTYAEATGHDH